MMKKTFALIFGFLITLFSLQGVLADGDIDGYLVSVKKNLSVNESVDLEVSAIKDGNIVEDYNGTIFIEIEGLLGSEYIVPKGGVYPFEAGDQGKKLFSKGLKVMKAGTYTLVIKDILDDNLVSRTTLVVGGTEEEEVKHIDIISPTPDAVELGDTVDVIGAGMELPNTPIKIFLNGEMVASNKTDSQGEFTSKINLTRTGDNILEIKAFDISNNLIGKSKRITFKSSKDIEMPAIKSVSIDPDTMVEKASKVTVRLSTREDIEIAKIVLGDSNFQMEKIAVGEFKKSFVAQKQGKIKIKFMIVEDGEEKIFDKNTVITVNEAVIPTHPISTGTVEHTGSLTGASLNSIGEIVVTPKSVDGSTIVITWKSLGDAKKFMVSYGTEKTTLEESVIVDTMSITVEKLNPEKTYFFQITPLNNNEDKDGKASDIVEYSFEDSTTCTVGNIMVKTKKIKGKNYLTREKVDGATTYEIYRTDTANKKTTISDMNKIGETKDTKFEYPFDITTKEEKYAYYAVQAVCKGGQKIQIGNVEKVKTGPFDNILVILILSGLVFTMYKLYKVSE